MEAIQQFALASGIAIGGGLLGAAVSAILLRRAQARQAHRLAAEVAAGNLPPAVAAPSLAPLLDALSQRIALMQQARDELDAQRRQLSADMVRQMQQTDGAMRAKDRFLSAISHDLRQPLQTMDLALAQLRREPLPAQARELVQLDAGMRTLAEVLDGLALLSQLDAGALQAHASACELEQAFASALAAQADAARRAGVSLHAHAGGHAVFTDPRLLGSLLERLLDNAIKASPGGARVLLAARRHGTQVRLEVPERDHRKGFGLGLPIVSRLAALLGTRVELRSRLHAGTCFWLALPRASVLQRPPRAVLLDRDPGHRDALAAMLRSWGYAVQAESAVDAACTHLAGGNGGLDAVLCAIDAGTGGATRRAGTVAPTRPRQAALAAGAASAATVHARRRLSRQAPRPGLRNRRSCSCARSRSSWSGSGANAPSPIRSTTRRRTRPVAGLPARR